MTEVDGLYGLNKQQAKYMQDLKSNERRAKKRKGGALHHPLAKTTAPKEEVLANRVWVAFHADRFENGASDDLAITAWSAYMKERTSGR